MNFYNLEKWLENTINELNIHKWTEIQEKALQLSLENKNFIGISPTGTGKTLAFLLPILNRINFSIFKLQSIIIAPTRELCRQIFSVLQEFKKNNKQLKVSLLIGGNDLNKSINNLKSNSSQIVISTPKRFLEVAKELPSVIFENINSFVLDEADMLLDLNFFPDINKIIDCINLNDSIIKIAMGATLHDLLNNEIKKIFKNITTINLNNLNLTINKISHVLIKTHDKKHALAVLVNQLNPYFCVIFTNTNKTANEVYKYLLSLGVNVTNLHSDLLSRERKNNYKSIKNNKFQYVVASDLFSRGLDIDGASHVINYDLPDDVQWYIHRSGRVGRGKYTGISYGLFGNNDLIKLKKILNKKIHFQVKQIKNNELVDFKINLKPKKKFNPEQENEINKIINKNKNNIKPKYKQKLKEKIKKIKQKYKHQHIDKIMKSKINQTYKSER